MIPIWSTSGSHISLAVKIGSTPSDFPAWIPEIYLPKLREKIIENVTQGHIKISYPLARKHPDANMFSIKLILNKPISSPSFFSSSNFFSYGNIIDNMHYIDSPNSWFSMELPVRAGYPAILAPSDVHRLQSRRPSDQSDYKIKNIFVIPL